MSTETISTNAIAAPVRESERITVIDSLRGFALLGILLMNIPYFAFPWQSGANPFLLNEWGTINGRIWYWVEMIPAGTQRAIFSLLFGAGMILFVTKLQKRLPGTLPVEYFLRRQLWLIVFGLFNAFVLLWFGDILFEYGIIGIVAFVFWRMPSKGLIVAAFVALLLMTARENKDLYHRKSIISKGELIAKIDTTSVKLNELQKEQLTAMTGMKEEAGLEAQRKEMNKNIREVRASYPRVYQAISNISAGAEFEYTYYGIWDVLIFMFLGMAFFKMGIITGKAPGWLYAVFCIVGLSLGLFLSNVELQHFIRYKGNGFEMTKDTVFSFHQITRVFRSFGVFGLLMLMYKSGWFTWLFSWMRPVGQMAFTNYLTHSLVCAIIFYGFGFAKYGQLQRYEIYIVVGIIWVFQIIFSAVWLRYFLFGPMEWVWRSLTYWRKQPMLRSKAVEVEKEKINAAIA